jgi:hypothetical protein
MLPVVDSINFSQGSRKRQAGHLLSAPRWWVKLASSAYEPVNGRQNRVKYLPHRHDIWAGDSEPKISKHGVLSYFFR